MKIFEKEMEDGVTCKYRTILSVEIYGFRGALRALMLLREDDERVGKPRAVSEDDRKGNNVTLLRTLT